MQTTKRLLIEILCEELPSSGFLQELPNIKNKFDDILKKYSLLSDGEFYYTSRRLVFYYEKFKNKQDDISEEFFGAPKEVAFINKKDIADGLSKAGESFVAKHNLDKNNLEFKEKNNKECLYCKKQTKGKDSVEILPFVVKEFIESLNFGKSMAYLDGEFRAFKFIRPIKHISVMLDDKVVEFSFANIQTSNTSSAHRSSNANSFCFDSIDEYFSTLKNNAICLSQDERKSKIIEQIKQLENKHNINVMIDQGLLDELVLINENPQCVLGEFSDEYLSLPKEVIVGSMKDHQRYFACFKDKEYRKIVNNFVVVTSSYDEDKSYVLKGNEKVLHARLSDGAFFYENDLKNKLDYKGLENISFLKGLGSLADKYKNEYKVATYLNNTLSLGLDEQKLQTANTYTKADLLSSMVGEFAYLQGIMGAYYAKAQGFDDDIVCAIREQYLPKNENDTLPSTLFSAIIAISIKIDTLLSVFSVGLIPSGSKDPYGLRRAVFGIIKICFKYNLELDFCKLLQDLKPNYSNIDIDQIMSFFDERYIKMFNDANKGINPSYINSVLKSTNVTICNVNFKMNALIKASSSNNSEFESLNASFKRVSNILKDFKCDDNDSKDSKFDLLEQKEELQLLKMIQDIKHEHNSLKTPQDYENLLNALIGLKEPLDSFFDNVFVNCENEKLSFQRKKLVCEVYSTFKLLADIKNISI